MYKNVGLLRNKCFKPRLTVKISITSSKEHNKIQDSRTSIVENEVNESIDNSEILSDRMQAIKKRNQET